LCGIILRVIAQEISRFVDRLRQHHGAEARRRVGRRLVAALLEPGKQVFIRRPLAVPDLLDLRNVDAAQVRQRLLGEPRRDTDAQAAGEQF